MRAHRALTLVSSIGQTTLPEKVNVAICNARYLASFWRPSRRRRWSFSSCTSYTDRQPRAAIALALVGRCLIAFTQGDFLLAPHSVPAAGNWVIGQAFHSRPFLIQALFDKPTLKVRKIGLKQSSISDDVMIMCAQTGDLLVGHRRH